MKTPAAQREVVLAPALVNVLREHWLASPHKTPEEFVFTDSLGRGRDYRDVGEGFRHAVKAAARAVLEASYQTMTGMQPREPRDPGSRSVVALLVAWESGPVVR